jgi:cob(I)alamin adenosyltransferase
MARAGYDEVCRVIQSGEYHVVILDEAHITTWFKLLAVEDLLALIDIKPETVELVFTGRRADPRLIDRADLVTEMCEVKHGSIPEKWRPQVMLPVIHAGMSLGLSHPNVLP